MWKSTAAWMFEESFSFNEAHGSSIKMKRYIPLYHTSQNYTHSHPQVLSQVVHKMPKTYVTSLLVSRIAGRWDIWSCWPAAHFLLVEASCCCLNMWAHLFYTADMFNFGLFWMLLLLVFMLDLFDSWEDILSSQYDIMRGHSLCFC